MTPPDHRARKIVELAKIHESYPGTDALEGDLFYLIKRGESTIPDVVLAKDIYVDDAYRHAFDALLLGKATNDLIVDCLGCSHEVLLPYRHLFFDEQVFKHNLARLRYIEELDLSNEEPEAIWKQYYIASTRQGPEYLANRLRVGSRPEVDPKAVVRSVAADAFDRFMGHRGEQLDIAITKEALKWGKTAMAASVVMLNKGADKVKDASKELEIALETVDRTQTPEEAGVDVKKILS